MQISKTAQFAEADILKSYAFERNLTGRWTGVTSGDLQSFWSKIPTSQHYLYIRFICSEATTILPELWAVSTCYTNTKDRVLIPGTTRTINKASYDVYRFSYADWVGGDMTITFSLNSNCEVYIADTCGMNKSKADAAYWLKYKGIAKSTAPLVISADEVASWSDRINEEGCFYAMLYANVNGIRTVTLSTNAPAEKDPVYPAASIALSCDESGNAIVRVSEDQHITILQGTTERKSFDAVVGQTYTISDLPEGTYILRGKNDEIELKL